MKCKFCGNELREGAVFCGNCGNRIPLEENIDKKALKKIRKEKKKKEKKPMGCGGCLLELILFIILVILIVLGISKGIDWYKNNKFNKFIEENVLVQKNEKIKLTETEKNEDWNNDGISNKDALDLNLNISVLDSDGDGLNDADEINIFKSNPLRYSTSGDIYSDGYKVKNGYDINVKYDTFRTIETSNKNLQLEGNDAYDMNAYYKEYTGTIPSGYYLGHQPFKVFSFNGEANLTMDDPNNYEVVSYDTVNKKVRNIKSRVEENNLVFEIKDDNPILVVYKEKILKNMEAEIQSSINSKYKNNVSRQYYVLAFPLLTALTKYPVHIYEVNNAKVGDDPDQVLVNKLNSMAQGEFTVKHAYINTVGIKVFDGFLNKIVNSASSQLDAESKNFINIAIMYKHVYSDDELYEFLYGIFSDSNNVSTDDSVIDNNDVVEPDSSPVIENNQDSDQNNNQENNSVVEDNTTQEEVIDNLALQEEYNKKYANMNCTYCGDSGFRVNVNSFAFENLSTTVSPGGVCAGFAYITTGVYNNFPIPRMVNGKYDLTDPIYYNIWNKTLYRQNLGEELHLYSDNVYANHHKLDSSKLEKPDSEIVKALEYYYQEVNDDLRMDKFGWAYNNSFEKQTFIESDTVDKLVSTFKSGKIVSVMLLDSNGQHAINAYKIAEDSEDPDVLYIKAYDNNLPNDKFWNREYTKQIKRDVTITLKRVYEDTWSGTKVKYVYNYDPMPGSSYVYSSFNGGLSGILFVDENGKIL